MDVVVRHVRDIEVHDVRKGLDIDSTRSDVGRHQDPILAGLEPVQRFRPLRLAAISVNPGDLHSPLLELLEDAIGAVFRAREDDRILDLAAVEQRLQKGQLQLLRRGENRLGDADRRRRFAFNGDHRRVLQHLPREFDDRRR